MDKNIQGYLPAAAQPKDANMRALQAQINPHFMAYNTLEFIGCTPSCRNRMELGDIIYEFSGLLRNNISDERVTTVENELNFVANTATSVWCVIQNRLLMALRSIRFGKDEDSQIHHPAFGRELFCTWSGSQTQGQWISVKVLQGEGQVMVLVTDNGRGMEEEQLEKFKNTSQSQSLAQEIRRKKVAGSPSELSMSMNACYSILEIATISKSSPNLTME